MVMLALLRAGVVPSPWGLRRRLVTEVVSQSSSRVFSPAVGSVVGCLPGFFLWYFLGHRFGFVL